VNYLDVGLKLEVEPLVSLEDDVGIKIGLEVSNISSEVKTAGGTTAYQVGTRNANTTLRLRDGETQVLAGLINDEDRRSATRVPGVARLPLIGRLFSNNNDTVTKTEIVLLITPRLVRTLARPEVRAAEFAAGTEAATGAPAGLSPVALPVPAAPQTSPATPQTSPAAPEAPKPAGNVMVPFGGVKPAPE
jgi:general secretion pathway protein D